MAVMAWCRDASGFCIHSFSPFLYPQNRVSLWGACFLLRRTGFIHAADEDVESSQSHVFLAYPLREKLDIRLCHLCICQDPNCPCLMPMSTTTAATRPRSSGKPDWPGTAHMTIPWARESRLLPGPSTLNSLSNSFPVTFTLLFSWVIPLHRDPLSLEEFWIPLPRKDYITVSHSHHGLSVP